MQFRLLYDTKFWQDNILANLVDQFHFIKIYQPNISQVYRLYPIWHKHLSIRQICALSKIAKIFYHTVISSSLLNEAFYQTKDRHTF